MRNVTAVVLAITALAIVAIGPAPRYLEELRIGGGFGEPVDGGADFSADGTIETDGPIASGGDVSAGSFSGAADHRLMLRVPDARTAELGLFESDTAHGGALWFDGASDTLALGTRDGSGLVPALEIAQGSEDIALQGNLATPGQVKAETGVNVGNSTQGVNGSIGLKAPGYTGGNSGVRIMHNASGTNDFGFLMYCNSSPVLQIDPSGAATISGNARVNGGSITAGSDSTTRGVITVWDGSGGDQPGYIKLHSPGGVAWYVFVDDTGRLRSSSSVPASNSDGIVVGLQF